MDNLSLSVLIQRVLIKKTLCSGKKSIMYFSLTHLPSEVVALHLHLKTTWTSQYNFHWSVITTGTGHLRNKYKAFLVGVEDRDRRPKLCVVSGNSNCTYSRPKLFRFFPSVSHFLSATVGTMSQPVMAPFVVVSVVRNRRFCPIFRRPVMAFQVTLIPLSISDFALYSCSAEYSTKVRPC